MSKSKDFQTPYFRVSFPYFDQPNAFENQEPRYGCDLIVAPEVGQQIHNQIMQIGQELIAANGLQASMAQFQWPQFKDGNQNLNKQTAQPKAGYAGMWYIKCTNPDKIPTVSFDATQQTNVPIDAKTIYSGCYATAIITVWLQDNKFGKRINVRMAAIQKTHDGESLGGTAPIDALSAFQAPPQQAPQGSIPLGTAGLMTQHQQAQVPQNVMLPNQMGTSPQAMAGQTGTYPNAQVPQMGQPMAAQTPPASTPQMAASQVASGPAQVALQQTLPQQPAMPMSAQAGTPAAGQMPVQGLPQQPPQVSQMQPPQTMTPQGVQMGDPTQASAMMPQTQTVQQAPMSQTQPPQQPAAYNPAFLG